MNDIKTISRQNKLTGLEIVKDIHVHPKQFTVEEGMLTPTMKLKRHVA